MHSSLQPQAVFDRDEWIPHELGHRHQVFDSL